MSWSGTQSPPATAASPTDNIRFVRFSLKMHRWTVILPLFLYSITLPQKIALAANGWMKTLSPSRMVGFMLGPPATNEMGVCCRSSEVMMS